MKIACGSAKAKEEEEAKTDDERQKQSGESGEKGRRDKERQALTAANMRGTLTVREGGVEAEWAPTAPTTAGKHLWHLQHTVWKLSKDTKNIVHPCQGVSTSLNWCFMLFRLFPPPMAHTKPKQVPMKSCHYSMLYALKAPTQQLRLIAQLFANHVSSQTDNSLYNVAI